MPTSTLCLFLLAISAVAQTKPASGGSGSPPTTNPNLPVSTPRAPIAADPLIGRVGSTDFRTITTEKRIVVRGIVQLEDGSPPPDAVRVEYSCGMAGETRTDTKGRFSFGGVELHDAANPTKGATPSVWGTNGCQLRLSSPGFIAINMTTSANGLEGSNLGTIILKRRVEGEGFTISVANASAPLDAKKAYDKARLSIAKGDARGARKDLETAVALYGKYPAAWTELGRLQMAANELAEARHSFRKALDADAKYLPPYERLAVMALRDQEWRELVDITDQLIQLSAYDFPEAYYLNSLGNLQLNRLAAAEKSGREALRQDPQRFSRANYLLGLVSAKRGDFARAAELVKLYLAAGAPPSEVEAIQKRVADFEKQASLTGHP